MRLPRLHYDHMQKHLPELLGLARASLDGVSTENLIDGKASDSWPGLASRIGYSGSQAMFAMVMFERCHQQVYAIGPKVADALCRTDLTGVTADMLEPPAPAFYVALPDCPWYIWGGDRSQWHQVGGFYVQKTTRLLRKEYRYRHGLHFFLWGMPNERSHGILDDAVYWFSVPIDTDEDLEKQFGTSEVRLADKTFGDFSEPEQLENLDTDDPKVRERHIQSAKNCFHLTVNMMLYLASEEADVSVLDKNTERRKVEDRIKRAKNDGKRKKLERRLENMPRTVITYVGPAIESEATSRTASSSDQSDRAAPRAHLVRPHWRHYWVGKKGEQRRVRRWIHMFERGSGEPSRIITKFREPEG